MIFLVILALFFPVWIRENTRLAGNWAFAGVIGLTALTLLIGYLHARDVRVKTLNIVIPKQAGSLTRLNAVFFSDVHVGPFMRVSRLEKIIRQINALNSDIVLFGGDMMNEEILPSELERLLEVLSGIKSRYGVFACTGNHEYFLDHQPVHLEEAAESGVDLQLSGHTHAGQVIPASWINDRLLEIGYGYGRKTNTQYYVTSGVGVWAPPARIGTNSEIVHLMIEFHSNK